MKSHPWAVLDDDGTPLFHVPGSVPPVFARDEALEQLWRAGQTKRKPLTFGSLFAGIGGLDLGLERAGMRCEWQVEIDDYAIRVLSKHWPNVPKFRDVRSVGADNLPAVDLICGGFPCQDLAGGGKLAGIDGARSGLWREFARIISELRPDYVLVENVSNLLSGNDGRWFGRVLGDLAALRYDAEWHCIPAAAVGAPHVRDRVFVVAYANRSNSIGRSSAVQVGRFPFAGEIAKARDAGRTQWRIESRPGVLAYGVSNRVEQLNGYGNAVVPQVAEFIGRQVVAFDECGRRGPAHSYRVLDLQDRTENEVMPVPIRPATDTQTKET